MSTRLEILWKNNYFTADFMISPLELLPEASTTVTPANYSYAMLQIPVDGQRRAEWHATSNPDAPVLSDRNVGAGGEFRSILKDTNGFFVAWNDNHVTYEKKPQLTKTRFGDVTNTDDNLFVASGNDDAYMIHSGQ